MSNVYIAFVSARIKWGEVDVDWVAGATGTTDGGNHKIPKIIFSLLSLLGI